MNHIALRDNGTIYVNNGSNTDQPTSKFVYELATPIEYDLTPTQVTMLLGTNNLWCDTGDTSVEYCADTKKYIAKMIANALNA